MFQSRFNHSMFPPCTPTPNQALLLSTSRPYEGMRWRKEATLLPWLMHPLHPQSTESVCCHYSPVSVSMLMCVCFFLFLFGKNKKYQKCSFASLWAFSFVLWTYPKQNNGIGAQYSRKIISSQKSCVVIVHLPWASHFVSLEKHSMAVLKDAIHIRICGPIYSFLPFPSRFAMHIST